MVVAAVYPAAAEFFYGVYLQLVFRSLYIAADIVQSLRNSGKTVTFLDLKPFCADYPAHSVRKAAEYRKYRRKVGYVRHIDRKG